MSPPPRSGAPARLRCLPLLLASSSISAECGHSECGSRGRPALFEAARRRAFKYAPWKGAFIAAFFYYPAEQEEAEDARRRVFEMPQAMLSACLIPAKVFHSYQEYPSQWSNLNPI